jgi:hypothetical protein
LPESPLEVRELGFHVEPAPGVAPNQDWSLEPGHQATTVQWAGHTLVVSVFYPGTGRPDWQLSLDGRAPREVSVHGVEGAYVEQFGMVTRSGGFDSSAGACGTSERGCEFWNSELQWEFAPGSWASVYGSSGESLPPQAATRAAFVKVADAVSSGGGASTRVPFRVESGLGPLWPPPLVGVGLGPSDDPPAGSSGSGWAVFIGEPKLEFSVTGTHCRPNAEEPETTVRPFTYRGHQGCLNFYLGELSEVVLRVDGVDRVIRNLYQGDHMEDPADLKQWLADLTVAPLDDPSTWYDLKAAFGD